MVHGAPVPAFPTVRIRGDPREADQVGEARQRAEVVAHVAPLMVRRHREGDGTGAVNALLPVDLLGDDVQGLVPADAHVSGLAAVLRIALAVGVEVDPFHRVKDALVGVDQRLERQRVRRDQATPWRAEAAPTCVDHPARRIRIVQLDRGHADDAVILDVDEQRPAIGTGGVASGAVAHGRAHRQADGAHHAQGLHEPDQKFVLALRDDLEVLGGVDDFALVRAGERNFSAVATSLKAMRTSGRGCLPARDRMRPFLNSMTRPML